jgi:hypothetical protein
MRTILHALILTLGLLAPVSIAAQPVLTHPWLDVDLGAWREAPAPWTLASRNARVTLVMLPAAWPYRICNESPSPVVVTADDKPVDLPARSCLDVAARSLVVSQHGEGIPARGTYRRLP